MAACQSVSCNYFEGDYNAYKFYMEYDIFVLGCHMIRKCRTIFFYIFIK